MTSSNLLTRIFSPSLLFSILYSLSQLLELQGTNFLTTNQVKSSERLSLVCQKDVFQHGIPLLDCEL